jgi:xylan 1,4-beta-xylosidase
MREPFGFVRLDAPSVPDVWHARTALTLYAVGPRSTVTVALNVAGLRTGDAAGLALFNRPYAWLGTERGRAGLTLARFDERGGTTCRVRLLDLRVWLRAECDFVRNEVVFRYSTDGHGYAEIGQPHALGPKPDAAHGIECSLFSCSTKAKAEGGHAEFDSFLMVTESAGHAGSGSRP